MIIVKIGDGGDDGVSGDGDHDGDDDYLLSLGCLEFPSLFIHSPQSHLSDHSGVN